MVRLESIVLATSLFLSFTFFEPAKACNRRSSIPQPPPQQTSFYYPDWQYDTKFLGDCTFGVRPLGVHFLAPRCPDVRQVKELRRVHFDPRTGEEYKVPAGSWLNYGPFRTPPPVPPGSDGQTWIPYHLQRPDFNGNDSIGNETEGSAASPANVIQSPDSLSPFMPLRGPISENGQQKDEHSPLMPRFLKELMPRRPDNVNNNNNSSTSRKSFIDQIRSFASQFPFFSRNQPQVVNTSPDTINIPLGTNFDQQQSLQTQFFLPDSPDLGDYAGKGSVASPNSVTETFVTTVQPSALDNNLSKDP